MTTAATASDGRRQPRFPESHRSRRRHRGLRRELVRRDARSTRWAGSSRRRCRVEPRHGAPSPRVAEFDGGMINAVGLANPGLEAVRREQLPWLATHLPRHAQDRERRRLHGRRVSGGRRRHRGGAARSAAAVDAFELNVSCPNTKAGGMEFGADPASLAGRGERGAPRDATARCS